MDEQVVELKQYLKQRHLVPRGNKPDLVKQLVDYEKHHRDSEDDELIFSTGALFDICSSLISIIEIIDPNSLLR
jgi:hypothetical protein